MLLFKGPVAIPPPPAPTRQGPSPSFPFCVNEVGGDGAKSVQEESIGKSWQMRSRPAEKLSQPARGVTGEETVPGGPGGGLPARGGAGRVLGEPGLGPRQPLVFTADLESARLRPVGAASAQWLTLPVGPVCCPLGGGLQGLLIHLSPDLTSEGDGRIYPSSRGEEQETAHWGGGNGFLVEFFL